MLWLTLRTIFSKLVITLWFFCDFVELVWYFNWQSFTSVALTQVHSNNCTQPTIYKYVILLHLVDIKIWQCKQIKGHLNLWIIFGLVTKVNLPNCHTKITIGFATVALQNTIQLVIFVGLIFCGLGNTDNFVDLYFHTYSNHF